MTSRKTRARIAAETVAIIKNGRYHSHAGTEISISSKIKQAKKGTRLFTPNDLDELMNRLDNQAGPNQTRFSVENCTTFAAAKKLLNESEPTPLCLNFASAKHPGGGFLNGSQAQEECLARASALYATINPIRKYYEHNQECGTSLYTHNMIYSPDVPVFRDDDDKFLDNPYLVSILTASAVNAGAVRLHEPENTPKVETVMKARIERVLAIALHQNHQSLVLGAWGCGVFKNEPSNIAGWFKSCLMDDQRFVGRFNHVVFAILDKSDDQPTYQAFAAKFDSQ